MSALCNCILNLSSAFAIFHAHSWIPSTGRNSLLQDSIGEAFTVTFLSVLVPSLIARRRRRLGFLPARQQPGRAPSGNPYLRSLMIAILFTIVFVALNAMLLPRLYPAGVSLRNIVVFKTVFGTVLGALATFLALHRILDEAP